jgi:hypothetical protein
MKKVGCLIILFFVIINLSGQTPGKAKESGYFNLTSFSGIIGSSDDNLDTKEWISSVTMVNGYSFNKHFSVGVGAGAEFYKYAVFPVFADFRYKFPMQNYTPFIALQGGYSFANNHKKLLDIYNHNASFKNKGGWMFGPQAGVEFLLKPNIGLVVGVGYRYQKLKSEIKESTYYPMEDVIGTTFNRLVFTIGILLK